MTNTRTVDGARTRGPTRRVLVLVYEEPERAAALVPVLSSRRMHIVTCAFDVVDGAWLDELSPDIVAFLPRDASPDMLDACELLRKQTSGALLVLSERKDESTVARALALGVDDYLALPMGATELAARIEALVRRISHNGHGLSTEIGDLMLSAGDLSVVRGGRKVYLSPTEFRLISCLAQAAGRVLTHDALMSRVWGPEYVDARHYLHLYVRYLREKLEDDPASPKMILSEWGIGYRLVLDEQAVEATVS